MKKFIIIFYPLMLFAFLHANGAIASVDSKRLCVFDLLGANGPVFSQMKDYQIAALDWGVKFQLAPYINEQLAAADFQTGQCDAVSMTGVQSRQFNAFSGSLDAIGALPDYAQLKSVVSAISSEPAATLMINGAYEVAGIIPIGEVFLFVKNRSMLMLGDVSKLRIAVMESDLAQQEMVSAIGAIPVQLSIANMYSQFNAHTVDVTYGPAIVYEAMELTKGLQPNGGVIRFPLAQSSLQIVIRRTDFPEGFGQKSRNYTLKQFDKAVKSAENYQRRIAQRWWIAIPEQDKLQYSGMFRKVRLLLRNKQIYDRKMLKIMRRERCKKDPLRQECTAGGKQSLQINFTGKP